jgi:hypothetical protein
MHTSTGVHEYIFLSTHTYLFCDALNVSWPYSDASLLLSQLSPNPFRLHRQNTIYSSIFPADDLLLDLYLPSINAWC